MLGPSASNQSLFSNSRFSNKRNPVNLIEAEKITEEKYVTGYNNFYEFSFDKEDVKDKPTLATEPWSIEISGMVQKPSTLTSMN